MKTVSVAIVVLTHDNLKDTVECLESVARLEYASFETVLVDNHSTDGSIEAILARFPQLPCVRNDSNLGVAGGRNTGWAWVERNVRCDYVFFLDNDVVLRPDSLARLVRALEAHPEVGITCAKAYTAPPSDTIMSVGLTANLYTGYITDVGSGEKDVGQYDTPRYVSACGGFAWLVRAELFRDLGGLDDAFNPYGWEDVDLGYRALKRGYRSWCEPAAVIHHKGCKIGRGYVPHYEKYKVKHYFLFLARHASPFQKLTCAVCIPFRAASSVLRLIVRGKGNVLGSHLSGAFESLRRGR